MIKEMINKIVLDPCRVSFDSVSGHKLDWFQKILMKYLSVNVNKVKEKSDFEVTDL